MNGAEKIIAERKRQVAEEGYTAEHDQEHGRDLHAAAICYWLYSDSTEAPWTWPWASRYWKPKDPERNLVRAGALFLAAMDSRDRHDPYIQRIVQDIAAEIDRLAVPVLSQEDN